MQFLLILDLVLYWQLLKGLTEKWGKFMKKWLGITLVVVALVMAMPYGLGILMERGLHQRQAEINQHLSGTLASEILQYHRGWLSSSATVKLQVNAKKLPEDVALILKPLLTEKEDVVTMIYAVKISHGPFVISHDNTNWHFNVGLASLNADCTLPWNAQMQKQIENKIGQQPLYHVYSLVHFTGKTTSHLQSAKVNFVDKQQDFQVTWDGASLDAKASKDLDQINLILAVAPLKAGGIADQTYLNLSPINLTANLQRGIEDMWFGKVAVEVKSIDIVVKGLPSFAVRNIDALSQQSVQNQKINTTLKYTVAEVNSHGDHYGPSVFILTLNQLSAAYMKIFSDMIHKNNLQLMTKEQLAYFGMQMVPDFLRMVDGAAIQMSFHTKSPQGLINVNLAVVAPKQTGKHLDPLSIARDTQGSLQMMAPKNVVIALIADKMKEKSAHEFIQKAVSTGVSPNLQSLALDAKKKAEDKLKALVSEGWVMDDKENYKLDFHYYEGRIKANGITKYDLLNPNFR